MMDAGCSEPPRGHTLKFTGPKPRCLLPRRRRSARAAAAWVPPARAPPMPPPKPRCQSPAGFPRPARPPTLARGAARAESVRVLLSHFPSQLRPPRPLRSPQGKRARGTLHDRLHVMLLPSHAGPGAARMCHHHITTGSDSRRNLTHMCGPAP